jgi:hypothetical protein
MWSVLDLLRPLEPQATIASVAREDWQKALLGPELSADPVIVLERKQLLRDLLAGEPAATSLVGLLLVFRAATAERMPMLLKDLGEAFYRWQPRSKDRASELEKSLASWATRTCHESGVPTSIVLVHCGEHFDSARHVAAMPGVEVAEVLGWIVLRENGKVYTKARVAVR